MIYVNKICIDTSNYNLIIKENDTYIIEIENDTNINISTKENINGIINLFIKDSKINLDIKLDKNSNLIINQLGINSSISSNINLLFNSNLRYSNSILSSVDSINKIKIIHKESESKCSLFASGINLSNNKFYFEIDGVVPKNSLNIELDENSKIINLSDGNSKIIPNLIIDNKEVVANHSAFIGTFTKEDIWYLNSRGIDEDDAKKLLFKSVLLGNMNCVEYDKFLNFISFNEFN